MRASTYPLIDADEAAGLVLDRTRVLPAERVTLAESVGRVLAEDVIAEGPLPAFRSSAVDGYAVRASDTYRARKFTPGRDCQMVPGHDTTARAPDITRFSS